MQFFTFFYLIFVMFLTVRPGALSERQYDMNTGFLSTFILNIR